MSTSLESPARPTPSAALDPHKPVMLIVDDETGPRTALRFVFKDQFNCISATGGLEGLAYARTNPVDIAILDVRMPDMSGVDVLRELKTINPDIECVLLTGYETLESARAALHYGAAEYLNKPFDVFNIREVVERCLARRHEKHQAAKNLRSLQDLNRNLTRVVADQLRTTTASALSAGVVHELNNPLSIIAGYIQLLDHDLTQLNHGGADPAPNIQHRLTTIQREIQRCKEIAERFLRFARAPRAQTEVINITPLVEDTALLLRAHPTRGQCRVTAQTSVPVLTVQASPVELMQVLINIGVNALQAMTGQGEIVFTAGPASAPSHPIFRAPTFDPQRPLIRISTSDTGCGIPPENIAKIFTPHFTTKATGTGLGLAVVADIVGKFNGAIEIISAVGNGTTFNIYLPAAGESPAAGAVTGPQS